MKKKILKIKVLKKKALLKDEINKAYNTAFVHNTVTNTKKEKARISST